MTFLMVTGADTSQLAEVGAVLQRAGLAAPKASTVYPDVTLDSWHTDIAAALDDGTIENLRQPGRIWEQLAIELMLANRRSECWGWASPQIFPVIDFWAEFDPRSRFLLVCEPLHSAITRFVVGDGDLAVLPEALAAWRSMHEALMRFYLRNPRRSILIWGHEASAHIGTLAAVLKERLGATGLQGDTAAVGAEPDSIASGENPLLQLIARNIAEANPDSVAVQEELAATVQPLQQAVTVEEPAGTKSRGKRSPPLYPVLVDGYRQAKAEVARAFNAQQGIAAENASRLAEAVDSQKSEALGKALADKTAEMQSLRDQLEGQVREATQENELLLSQLHQVQEELERYFLDNQKLTAEAKDTQARVAALEKEKGELAGARDAESKAKAEAQARVAALEKEKGELAGARDAESKAKAEAQQENELLLTQLHQVQEELERYFLEHQANSAALRELEEQFSRMLGSVDGAFDCRRLELIDSSDANAWRWRALGVRVVGHQKEALEFTSRIERGCAVLTLERPTEGNSPLLRWPAIAGDGKVLTLAAMRDGAGGESWLETLATLSTSDWDLTAGLLRRMLYAVAAREVVVKEGEMPRQLEGLGVAVRALDAVGPFLRFDTFQVTAESENSKRTVLALELSHLSLGGVRLPKLAFQLQAALEPGGHIGNDFFLIFGRATAAQPFKTWVGNAKGAEGEDVMAVPFTSDPGSMGLWATLSQADRLLLRSLVKLLPACFRSMSPSGKQIKRPVDQWLSACERLSKINTEPKAALNAPAAATQDPPQGKTVKAKPPPARVQAGAKTAAKRATAAASVKPVAKSGKPAAKKAAR